MIFFSSHRALVLPLYYYLIVRYCTSAVSNSFLQRAAKLRMENIPQYLCKIRFYICIVKQIDLLYSSLLIGGV